MLHNCDQFSFSIISNVCKVQSLTASNGILCIQADLESLHIQLVSKPSGLLSKVLSCWLLVTGASWRSNVGSGGSGLPDEDLLADLIYHKASVFIGNSCGVKLVIYQFWSPFFHLWFWFALSCCWSYFQRSAGSAIHFRLSCTVCAHNLIGIWHISLSHNSCRFPLGILPV